MITLKVASFFVATVLIISVLYRYYRHGEIHIIQLTVSAFLFRLAAALYPALYEWDERYHALVAKNLAQHPLIPRLYPADYVPYNYQNWICNYIWLHKQPFSLWSIALSIKLFGANDLAVRAPSIFLSTIAVFFTFLIGKWLFSERVGLLAAVFHCLNGLIVEMTGGGGTSDHIDIFFSFFIETAILLAVYSRYKLQTNSKQQTVFAYLTGLLLGIAILCKWLPALIIVPIYLILHWKENKYLLHTSIVLLSGLIVAFPWQLFAAISFPREFWYEMNFNNRHVYEVIENQTHSFLYHFSMARIIWNELVYLTFIWLLYSSFKKPNRKLVALTAWIFVPYLFFTLVVTKMPAYVLFCGPAIFIAQSLFLENLDKYRYKYLKPVLSAAFLVLAFRYCVERVKPFNPYPEVLAAKTTILQLKETYGNNKTAFFNVQPIVEVMFYTDFLAYGHFPSEENIDALTAAGYQVVVVDSPNMPGDLRTNKRVKIYEGALEPKAKN